MNPKTPFCFILISICCCLLCFAAPASSQEVRVSGRTGNDIRFSLLAAYMHQFDAALDNGGDFRMDKYFLRMDGSKRQSDVLSLGVGLTYDLSNYSFSGTAVDPILNSWDQVHALNLSVTGIYSPDDKWKLFVAPSLGVAAESGADWGDSLVYGGIVWTSFRVTPELALGLGAGLFSKPEEFSAFPVIVIDWKISDRVRLSNPPNEGVTGPAGLEMSYKFDGGSSVSAGGSYRSQRFRLDDSGVVRGGVCEDKGFPVWLKLSTKIGAKGTLSFLGGVIAGGELAIEDSQGNKVEEQNYDASPFLSSAFLLRF